MLLWDMKFQNTPEERIGALFWMMHRCARIIFFFKPPFGEKENNRADLMHQPLSRDYKSTSRFSGDLSMR
jgi:hypothetical protein